MKKTEMKKQNRIGAKAEGGEEITRDERIYKGKKTARREREYERNDKCTRQNIGKIRCGAEGATAV